MPLSTVAGLIAYVDEISVVLGPCSPSAKAPETIASLICSATCRNNGVVPEKSNRIRRLQPPSRFNINVIHSNRWSAAMRQRTAGEASLKDTAHVMRVP